MGSDKLADNMKKLLIYIPPFIEQDRPNLNNHWVILTSQLLSELLKVYEITVVMGEGQKYFLADKYPDFSKIRLCVIKDRDLGTDVNAYNQIYALYQNSLSDNETIILQTAMQNAVGMDYCPDFVLFYMNPISFLKELYPSAKYVGCEAGGLFQSPFPRSWYFDVLGDKSCSYLLNYADNIRSLTASKEQNDFVEEIRKEYFSKINLQIDNAFDLYKDVLTQFKHNVLLPLQVSNIYSFDLTCQFKSQFHYLKYVLDNISPGIGVVVTEHPYFPQMNKQWIEYFTCRYKNFIYIPITQEYFKCSEALLRYCDAVINVSSTVGFLALWWKKALVSLGNNYFSVFSDYSGLSGLPEFLAHPCLLDKNAILYHLINHYWVLDDVLNRNAYLPKLLARLENGTVDFEFYSGLTNAEENKKYILEAIRKTVVQSTKIPEECFGNWPLMPLIVNTLYNHAKGKEMLPEEKTELLNAIQNVQNQLSILDYKIDYINHKIVKLEKKSFTHRIHRWMKKIIRVVVTTKVKDAKLKLHILGIKMTFNLKKISLRNKFAFLSYSYTGFTWFEDELNTKKYFTVNLGDNIQAYAVKQLYEKLGLKKIKSIDRDTLSNYKGEKINLLTNAVFSSKEFPNNKKINPIFLGFNTPDETAIVQNKEFLMNYVPIGCRDCYTAGLLKRYGIPAYVTGCYSLTLPKRSPCATQNKVFFVGVSEELKKYIPSHLLKNAEFIVQRDETYHFPLTTEDMHDKNIKAQKLLQRYRDEACLVVTPLLHCASPCLAMGIPVILARDEYDNRFSAIKKLTPLYLRADYDKINWNPEVVDLEELKSNMIIHAKKLIINNKFDKKSYEFLTKTYLRSPDKFIHNTWTKEMEYSEIMERRAAKIVSLIDLSTAQKVMDCGCGKQTLAKYLPQHSKYIPVDQYNHIDSTIIKDFNAGEFLFEKVDVVFCLGIFEYIYDLPAFITKIAQITDCIAASYIFYGDRDKPEYVVNKYTEDELWTIFTNAGFKLEQFVPEDKELQIGRNSLFIMRK